MPACLYPLQGKLNRSTLQEINASVGLLSADETELLRVYRTWIWIHPALEIFFRHIEHVFCHDVKIRWVVDQSDYPQVLLVGINYFSE